MTQTESDELIRSLMKDVTGEDLEDMSDDAIKETISNILHEYNLNTDMSFVEKIATLSFPDSKNKNNVSMNDFPDELKNAAYLPGNTLADIALRQDIDLIISQLPEWYKAIQITRDAICESDVVDGKISRDIRFKRSKMTDNEETNIMSKIEEVEDRLELNQMIKNHLVFGTLEYGEQCIYAIPYAKVFQDLYKYRMATGSKGSRTQYDMMNTSSVLNGYGYGEAAVEVSLKDTIINESTNDKNKNTSIFTESEIMEINKSYRAKILNESGGEDKKAMKKRDSEIDDVLEYVSTNIRYIGDDIALPVIEESAHDLKAAYETKYRNEKNFIQEADNLFNRIMNQSLYMEDGGNQSGDFIDHGFDNISGIYLKVLPATKLIPIRIDRQVIGYYYISDMTRPEQAGQRKNSGIGGYSLRSPSVGYDTLAPDRVFCEKLANKIINNFNLKFMKDNIALHQQIVTILQSHKFNDAMMRFVFIPAEHVIQCTINKDGVGRGHSMLEPGLVVARMYMFLKLYTILYQINNSAIRVINLHMSGLDTDYKKFVNETVRKFTQRRITPSDIFNYTNSMNKVSGCSELVMPMGAGDKPPISIETIPPSDPPLNAELLESLKNEAIAACGVPPLMVQAGGESQIEFAKEAELSNTEFNTMVSSYKIDMNIGVTKLYRRILRWETDIDPNIIKELTYVFRMPTAKTLNVTVEMINNFNAIVEAVVPIFFGPDELTEEGSENPSEKVRQFKKLLLHEQIPQLDIDKLDELASMARFKANEIRMEKTGKGENIIDSSLNTNEGGEF